MTAPPPPDVGFDDLPPEEQRRIRTCGAQMIELARQHTGGLIFARSKTGRIKTASYCLMEKDGTPYLVTAEHILLKQEELAAEDSSISWKWQAGDLLFDPRGRIAARDHTDDLLLIELARVEVPVARVPVFSVAGWPPPVPKPGDYVLVAGYPAVITERPSPREVDFRALAAMLPVTTSGESHLWCQWDRENMVHFSGAGGIPPHGIELGGMSGGPVCLVRQLDYPLVGIVTDFHSDWELMRLGMLSAVDL